MSSSGSAPPCRPTAWLRCTGLATDCAAAAGAGRGHRNRRRAYDETNTRIRPERIARDIRQCRRRAWSGFVGVQSNQFPRAMDLARRFSALASMSRSADFMSRARSAMLPQSRRSCRRRSTSASRCMPAKRKDGLEELLRDAAAGHAEAALQPHGDLPNLAGVPIPYLPPDRVERTAGRMTTFDAGRGCPFQCSFCTIINVQGRVSRRRTADDVEAIVRAQRRARRAKLLHHRRQFRPQQGLGADLRSADRAAGTGWPQHQADDPGRHALPPDPALHREGQARRRRAGLHWAGVRSTRTACSPRRRNRTASPSIATCCWRGSASAR